MALALFDYFDTRPICSGTKNGFCLLELKSKNLNAKVLGIGVKIYSLQSVSSF